MRRRNSEYAKMRINRRIGRMSALDVALNLHEYRTKKEDLDLFADTKPYLTKKRSILPTVTVTRRDRSRVASFGTHPVLTP